MLRKISAFMLYLSQKVQLLPYCEYSLEVAIVLLNFIPLSVLGVSLNIVPWLMKEHSTKPLLLCFLPSHFFGFIVRNCVASYLRHKNHQVNLMFHSEGKWKKKTQETWLNWCMTLASPLVSLCLAF